MPQRSRSASARGPLTSRSEYRDSPTACWQALPPGPGRPQERPITARSSIGQPSLGSGLRRRSVQQAEPASDLGAFCGEQSRVPGAGGLLQEEPAILGLRFLEAPVIAERRDGHARENLL